MNGLKQTLGQAAIKLLLEKTNFSPEETELRFEQAISPEYWQKLNPQLNVCKNLKFDNFETESINQEQNSEILEKLNRESYFKTQPLINISVVEKMRKGIENLRQNGWHELCAFVYDEFWQVTRTPSIVNLLSNSLGKGFRAMPHVVVHYVHTQTGTGWGPHIDFSDRKDRFTLWFALSDATIENGCIYVIPKNRLPDDLLNKYINLELINHKEINKLLHNTHALPVKAGSFLGWEGDVIHWGTYSSTRVDPRISLSVVYLRENIEPLEDEIPLLLPTELPTFAQRMFSVAKAFNYYNIHVLALRKYHELSKRLIKEFRARAISEQ